MKKSKYVIVFVIAMILIIFLWIGSRKEDSQFDNYDIKEKEDVILEDYVEYLENGTLRNVSEKLKKSMEIEGVKIGNINITSEHIAKDMVSLKLNVQNISNININGEEVTLVMYDSKNKEIGRAELGLPNLDVSQVVTVELNMPAEFINVYDILVL